MAASTTKDLEAQSKRLVGGGGNGVTIVLMLAGWALTLGGALVVAGTLMPAKTDPLPDRPRLGSAPTVKKELLAQSLAGGAEVAPVAGVSDDGALTPEAREALSKLQGVFGTLEYPWMSLSSEECVPEGDDPCPRREKRVLREGAADLLSGGLARVPADKRAEFLQKISSVVEALPSRDEPRVAAVAALAAATEGPGGGSLEAVRVLTEVLVAAAPEAQDDALLQFLSVARAVPASQVPAAKVAVWFTELPLLVSSLGPGPEVRTQLARLWETLRVVDASQLAKVAHEAQLLVAGTPTNLRGRAVETLTELYRSQIDGEVMSFAGQEARWRGAAEAAEARIAEAQAQRDRTRPLGVIAAAVGLLGVLIAHLHRQLIEQRRALTKWVVVSTQAEDSPGDRRSAS